MNKLVLRYLKIWVFPLVFVLAIALAFVVWAERQMRVPGGYRDVLFMEQTLSSSKKIGDFVLMSDYFKHRAAEILALPNRDPEALLLYQFINHLLAESSLDRGVADLKYAVAVYKKQLLISSPSSLRIYLSLCEKLRLFKSVSLGRELVSDSDSRMKALQELSEGISQKKQGLESYEQLLTSPEFSKLRSLVMLKLAFLNYELSSDASKKWINQAKRAAPSSAAQFVLDYLEKKARSKEITITESSFRGAPDESLSKLLDHGLFTETKKQIELNQAKGFGSLRLREAESWLGLESHLSDKERLPFFSVYFNTLNGNDHKPAETADKLAALATDQEGAIYSAFLRYQAWGMAFFDAQDFSRASLFKDFLKNYDTLSLFSQLDSLGGMFKFVFKEYTGVDLDRIWEKTPHLFDRKRSEEWEGFKSAKKRISQTIVYEGQVYVVNYDAGGVAQKMQIIEMNQMVSEKKPEVVSAAPVKKTGWIDRYIYDVMIQFIPEGVREFKKQIANLSRRKKDSVFTRVYTEIEFKQFILESLGKKFGGTIKEIQASINEDGFFIEMMIDLKVVVVPVSGVGKLMTEGESGQLNLTIDHVKVKGLKLPDWILRKVEDNFSVTANTNDAKDQQELKILDMNYKLGGIQIKCRNPQAERLGAQAA